MGHGCHQIIQVRWFGDIHGPKLFEFIGSGGFLFRKHRFVHSLPVVRDALSGSCAVKALPQHYATWVALDCHGVSNAVKLCLRFFSGGVGPEIADFGSLSGPTRPLGGLAKAPAGVPLDVHRFPARFTNPKAIP